MPFVAGRGAWPSALSRARVFRVHRNVVKSLDRSSGRIRRRFEHEGQERGINNVTLRVSVEEREAHVDRV